MAFDPSTAEPVTAVVEPEFDPSTAQPVASERVGGASGSWGPREASPGIPAQTDYAARERAREARGVAKVDLSQPTIEIPQLPEIKATEGEPLTGVEKAASIGAGVYNEAAKVVSSFTTLPNIAMLVTTGGLANAARAGSPAARRALVGIGAYFSGSMAKDAIEQVPEASKVVSDPNASLQEKTAAIASPAITATMSVLAGLGAVHEARPDLTKILREKTPVEAEAIVRQEAAKTENPAEQAKLTSAADEIATGLKDNEAAKQTFDPGTAEPVQGSVAHAVGDVIHDYDPSNFGSRQRINELVKSGLTRDEAIQKDSLDIEKTRTQADALPLGSRVKIKDGRTFIKESDGWHGDNGGVAVPSTMRGGVIERIGHEQASAAPTVERAPGPAELATHPETVETTKRELENPDNTMRFTVLDSENSHIGKPLIAQVDFIDSKTGKNTTSTNAPLLRELGSDVPISEELPTSIKNGNYTLDELKAEIQKANAPSDLVKGDNFDKAWEAGGKQAGSENQIVVENGRVYKRNYNAGLDQALPNHGTLEAFNENLAIHNEIFPETALKFEGMSETPAGPAPVVSQVEVKGVEATKPEIDAFMAEKGFEPYSNSAYVNKEQGLRVGDLKGDNVIKDANGVLHVIDPVIKRIEPEPAAVGLGAASPAEFRPVEESATSLNNEAVDKEREARGEKPLMQVAKKGFGQVWDQAMRAIDENQNVADDLIAVLKEKSRAVTDVEQAILLHREIDLKNQLAKVTKNLADKIGTEDSLTSDRLNRARILDELSDLESVSQAVGTETSRGLNARKLIAREDYSLANMLTERRADRGGAKLTEKEIAEVKKQHDEIEEAQRALDQHEAQQELDAAITTPDEATAEIKKLEKEIKAEEKKPAPEPKSKEETALKQFKTRTQKRIESLRKKIEAGDFSKPEARKPITLDEESLRLKAELRRTKDKFQETLLKDRLAKRTTLEKAQDTLVKWRRGFLLSSPVTLAKLTSAALQRMAFTPLEELVGAGIGKVIPKIAGRAPREGGLNVTAEAKAITQGLTKGMSDASELLRTGKTNLEVLFGKGREGGVKESDVTPRSVIDFFGQIHGALKAPVKRAEFARSLEKRMAFAIKNGVDVSDPMVQTRLMVDAYKDANRSIFLQDNIVVSAYNRAVGALLEKQKATGKPSTAGKAIATTAKVLLPIVRVPTNIVAETIQTATGTLTGSYRLARTLGRAAKDISPDEADLVLRDLKKGSLGAALILVGYFNAKNIGGYYQSGQKRSDKDVQYGSVKIGGINVPSYLLHNPLIETLQIGATIRRVAESKLLKKDKDPQGLASGAFAAALGLTEEVPFVRQQVETAKMLDSREGPYARGEFVKSLVVPSAVDFTARQLDKDAKGNTIQRKPSTVIQHIETGIPGLRQNVPKRR